MEYKNELGQTINDEQLDKMLEDIENENFENFEPTSELVYGLMEPLSVKRSTVCVQFPETMKEQLTDIAKQHSCSLSALIRAYAYDGIQKELKLG